MPNRLRQLRDTLDLRAVDVARQAGLSKPALSNLERRTGIGSADSLAGLAQAFDVPMYQLYRYLRDDLPLRRLLAIRSLAASLRTDPRITAWAVGLSRAQRIPLGDVLDTIADTAGELASEGADDA